MFLATGAWGTTERPKKKNYTMKFSENKRGEALTESDGGTSKSRFGGCGGVFVRENRRGKAPRVSITSSMLQKWESLRRGKVEVLVTLERKIEQGRKNGQGSIG
ncbi:hypothetical protein RJT34_01314 [Clitoria ternatea]|uniref:Uncharacterized protein n=1 Tax=Clitoria ternatea TaxID=43366 RepID=A0AAN9KHL0_CLITE